nr:uncharacterized protein LOC119713605 [Anas platyrhynchos]
MSVPSTLLVLFFPGGWTSTMWDSRSLPWSPSLMPGVYRTSGAQDSVLQRTNSSDRCLCFTEGFNIFSCLRGQTAMLVLFTSSLPVLHVRGKPDSHHFSLLEVPGGEAILFHIPEESNGDENRGQRGKPPAPAGCSAQKSVVQCRICPARTSGLLNFTPRAATEVASEQHETCRLNSLSCSTCCEQKAPFQIQPAVAVRNFSASAGCRAASLACSLPPCLGKMAVQELHEKGENPPFSAPGSPAALPLPYS